MLNNYLNKLTNLGSVANMQGVLNDFYKETMGISAYLNDSINLGSVANMQGVLNDFYKETMGISAYLNDSINLGSVANIQGIMSILNNSNVFLIDNALEELKYRINNEYVEDFDEVYIDSLNEIIERERSASCVEKSKSVHLKKILTVFLLKGIIFASFFGLKNYKNINRKDDLYNYVANPVVEKLQEELFSKAAEKVIEEIVIILFNEED